MKYLMFARGELLGGRITGLYEKPTIFTTPTRAINRTRKVKTVHG